MKERINESNKNIGNSVMQTIRGFAVIDENVDRPHIETMKDVYKNIITAAYDNLWNEVNTAAEAQKRTDQEAVTRQRQEADRINRDAQRIRQEFEEEEGVGLQKRLRKVLVYQLLTITCSASYKKLEAIFRKLLILIVLHL
jgi:hypothetical protein